MHTATRNVSNEPSEVICVRTIAASPAAGPETLICEPLNRPTTSPPTMPDTKPAISGAPDACAMPRHSGNATRNTTRPAMRSRRRVGPSSGVAAIDVGEGELLMAQRQG